MTVIADLSPMEVRKHIRKEKIIAPTTGMCPWKRTRGSKIKI